MEDFKKRILNEFTELNDKCEKLGNFINTNKLYNESLPEIQVLMRNQLRFMEGYRQCLYDRIQLIITEKELEEFEELGEYEL